MPAKVCLLVTFVGADRWIDGYLLVHRHGYVRASKNACMLKRRCAVDSRANAHLFARVLAAHEDMDGYVFDG